MLFLRLAGALLLTDAITCDRPAAPPFSPAELPAVVTGRAAIQGGVHDLDTGRRIAGALIVLQCECLPRPRETETDARGIYSFDDLPPGSYSIEAMYGRGDVRRDGSLPAGSRTVIHFAVDPDRPEIPISVG